MVNGVRDLRAAAVAVALLAVGPRGMPAAEAVGGQPVHPADVYESRSMLRELMSDVVFWANFEESHAPVWRKAYQDRTKAIRGEYGAAPGLVGQAFVSEQRSRCCYPAHGNLDLARPGAISFWVCPTNWERSKPTGIRNGVFGTNFSEQGYPGINRVAAKEADGRVVQQDMVFFYADHFPGANTVRVLLGDSLGPDWASGTWHLFVVNWKGSHFEASVDGGARKSGDLGCAVNPVAVNDFLVGGCQERTLIDEFMIYRRPLTDIDLRVIADALHLSRRQ